MGALGAKALFFTLSDTLLLYAHGLPDSLSQAENSRMIHPLLMRCTFLMLCAVVSACSTVSGSGRNQVNFYSAADDARIGQQAWSEVLSDPLVVRRGPQVDRVQRVGDRVVAAARRLHPEIAAGFQWEFAVLDDPDQINAFALPGGKFAVYTGMLDFTEGDDDMLAAVLGHEAAHVTSRHGTERLTQVTITRVGLDATNVFVLGDLEPGDRAVVLQAIGAGANVGVLLPFSRSHESEADVLGVMIAADAGYRPQAALRLWERMAERGSSGAPEFISTHPSYETRIQLLQEAMAPAQRLYDSREVPGDLPSRTGG